MNKFLKNVWRIWYPSLTKKPMQFCMNSILFMPLLAVPIGAFLIHPNAIEMHRPLNFTPIYWWIGIGFILSGLFGYVDLLQYETSMARWNWNSLVDRMTDCQVEDVYNKLQYSKQKALRKYLKNYPPANYSDIENEMKIFGEDKNHDRI